jgi:hypothetical protein
MSNAEEYHARADRCKARAEKATNPAITLEFEQLADKWRTLAIQEEADERPHCAGRRAIGGTGRASASSRASRIQERIAEPGSSITSFNFSFNLRNRSE